MKKQLQASLGSPEFALTLDLGYISSMKMKSMYSMTTGELMEMYRDLRTLGNSKDCPYDDWLDIQMTLESIDEELMQRELDELTERFTDEDEAYDNLQGAAQWTNTGPAYDEA